MNRNSLDRESIREILPTLKSKQESRYKFKYEDS